MKFPLWIIAVLLLGSPALHAETGQEVGGVPEAKKLVSQAKKVKTNRFETQEADIGSFKRFPLPAANASGRTYIVVRSGPQSEKDKTAVNRFLDGFVPNKFQGVKPGSQFTEAQNNIIKRAADIPIKTIDEMVAESLLTDEQAKKVATALGNRADGGALALIAGGDEPQDEAKGIYIKELRTGAPGSSHQTLVVVASEEKKAEFKRLFSGVIPFELFDTGPNDPAFHPNYPFLDSVVQRTFPFPDYPYRFPEVLILSVADMRRALSSPERLHELQALLETHLAVVDRIICTSDILWSDDD